MTRINLIAIVSALLLFLVVLELVRRRRLREEYSWLWLIAAFIYLLVAVWPELSIWATEILGAQNAVLVFTFLGMQFLVLILIQYSIKISRMNTQIKDLTQQIAILDSEYRKLDHEFGVVSSQLENSDNFKSIEGSLHPEQGYAYLGEKGDGKTR